MKNQFRMQRGELTAIFDFHPGEFTSVRACYSLEGTRPADHNWRFNTLAEALFEVSMWFSGYQDIAFPCYEIVY